MSWIVKKEENICQRCFWCENLINCPINFAESECFGCGACVLACPYEARKIFEVKKEKKIEITVDGEKFEVFEKITVRKALETLGYKFGKIPNGIFIPCEVGGCGCCSVEINGQIRPSCVTPIKAGMKIKTEPTEDLIPRRLVGSFMPHPVGGVGTPWYLKGEGYIEVALFTAGCNLRCPQCQNWTTTYRSREDIEHKVLTPKEAAERITQIRRKYKVNRMAISGGECTLNRRWLIEYLRELKRLNPDREARLHVDTNGSLLTEDYIDELIDAGMTDIGIDLKSLKTETFMVITGLQDRKLAEIYKETAWHAVKYIVDKYRDRVFVGIGIPYNRKLISAEEIEMMGKEIYKIAPEIQVCVLDYRPEFRRRDIPYPEYWEMKEIYRILKNVGLKIVICQTRYGYIGP
ncbi:MAG: radical SAM protein [Thermodesulfovibrionaceae bacterium]